MPPSLWLCWIWRGPWTCGRQLPSQVGGSGRLDDPTQSPAKGLDLAAHKHPRQWAWPYTAISVAAKSSILQCPSCSVLQPPIPRELETAQTSMTELVASISAAIGQQSYTMADQSASDSRVRSFQGPGLLCPCARGRSKGAHCGCYTQTQADSGRI